MVGYKIGLWLNDKKPIKLKKHDYKEQSFFRYGLDYITAILFDRDNSSGSSALMEVFEVLCKPPKPSSLYFDADNSERLMEC